MHTYTDRARRLGVTALALVAAGAAVLGGSSAASAASGTSNQGASSIVIAPTGGAMNFLADEATGTFTWNMSNGQPDSASNWTVAAGDQATYVLNAPSGLTFPNVAQNCDANQLSGFTVACSINTARNAITLTYTATASGPVGLAFSSQAGLDFPVRAIDGLWVSGAPTVVYTPFPGLGATTTATGVVQQSLPDSNQGVSNATLTPRGDAVNFSSNGTQGVIAFTMGNGTPDTGAAWSLNVGDRSAYQIDLVEGLRFLGTNPVCPTDLYSFATTTCEISADQRRWIVRSVVTTAVVDSTAGWAGVDGPNWLAVTEVAGVDTDNADAGRIIWTPWYEPGSNDGAVGQSTRILFNTTPASETPLLAGGVIAGVMLAGGGAVYGIRRRRAAQAR